MEKPLLEKSLRTLRARWRTASLASGWRFPSDWALPEVDAVCSAVLRGRTPDVLLVGLARARAATGAGLAETLADLAALHNVLADHKLTCPDVDDIPSRLLRVAAVAWADVALSRLAHVEVTDPLTGLTSAAYLRTRLGELYRGSVRRGRPVAEEHTVLVVGLDLREVTGWPRATAMILTAEALRAAFDGGETLASLGPSTAAAVLPRDGQSMVRAVRLRRELHDRLSADTELDGIRAPRLRMVRLPPTHEGACALLSRLGRA
ncbi:MAG TPA: GGDEF domain-containing protein [Amycolatopsis sp.]|uniref:GGDEF domain-containing protein n=1 Tax=Amycolatopsis sp. TaxID=37632 RepID=UPI002B4731DF|nr:GGDEF domain-containing protein [Amycolatopsis sp.]HKS46073.1 GGDEF domain-containing protein [Amycolatopsis sp.]